MGVVDGQQVNIPVLVNKRYNWGKKGHDKLSVLMIWRPKSKSVSVGKSAETTVSFDGKFSFKENDLTDLSLQEKCRSKLINYSYRKPTQVYESSRLRQTEERWLRNSAKKLGVISRDSLPDDASLSGLSKRISSDCLTKTQVYAKA